MEGYKHLIVVGCGVLGLLLGGVLIDLDHKATWSCMWKNFWGRFDCPLAYGIIHKPVVMLSIALFNLCMGVSIFIHYIMDGLK